MSKMLDYKQEIVRRMSLRKGNLDETLNFMKSGKATFRENGEDVTSKMIERFQEMIDELEEHISKLNQNP
jgi:CHASE1-domain containing sensor protein